MLIGSMLRHNHMSVSMQQQKWWLTVFTYDWSKDGFSGSRESVLNQMFEKLKSKSYR